MPGITELIGDLGDGRIARMDAAGVDVQVLSLGGSSIDDLPVAQATSIVRECNDVLADAISKNPTRLKGFVAIPAAGPDAAVAEIERCMKLDGFVGISVLSHISGGFLDQEKFTPILETAEKLETPIYIHPTYSIPAVKDIYYNVGNPVATAQFSQASWGWHIETAIHVLRLAFSGTFDRFPKLQIAVGHLGEGLPFFLNRLGTTTYAMVEAGTIPLQRKIPEYLRENVSYSIGAFNWKPPFDLLVEIMGVDRVLFSSDYPFSPGTGSDAMKVAMDFLMAAGLSDEDRNKVAYLNTEKLFKL
ncbi:MAG: amidohydrolase [Coriobacteriia bacterium]|nr:amidohydrolase [Coriobacteriia bacterium]